MAPSATTNGPTLRSHPSPSPSSTQGRAAWLRRLLATPKDPVATIARLALGIMIVPHGMQKLFGVFGGYGFAGTMQFFTGTLGIPWVFGLLAIVAEFFGGLGLISGLLGRVAALGVGSVMLVAALTSHVRNGFFMNWFGAQMGEGIEFFILAIALSLVVLVRGSGAWSIDRAVVCDQ
jgi:putative oxidoreductase